MSFKAAGVVSVPPLLILLAAEWERESYKRILAYFGISSFPENGSTGELVAAIASHLPRLTTEDVRRLGQDADRLPSLLAHRNPAERNEVLRHWRFGPAKVPEFAERIVRFLWSDVEHHKDFKGELLEVLLPVALSTCEDDDYAASSLRELLAANYPDVLPQDSRLQKAHQRDLRRKAAEEDERKRRRLKAEADEREREARLIAVREARIAEISAMPLRERLELLMASNSGIEGPYPDSWSDLTEADLRSLDTKSRQDLVRKLRRRKSRIFRRVRSALKKIDQSMEAELRKAFTASLAEMSLLEQLEHLAGGEVRLGRYPVSLAYEAINNSSQVPVELRQRVVRRLAGQHGAWESLRRTFEQQKA
jgi:hypothetical protein